MLYDSKNAGYKDLPFHNDGYEMERWLFFPIILLEVVEVMWFKLRKLKMIPEG